MELSAQELRIGNYIKTPSGDIKIKALDFDALHENKPQYYIHNYGLEQCKPIPLTEQWLLDFGFEKANDTDSFYKIHLNNHTNLHYSFKWSLCEISISGLGYDIKEMKHVHSLMNLYFALTGTELTLKTK